MKSILSRFKHNNPSSQPRSQSAPQPEKESYQPPPTKKDKEGTRHLFRTKSRAQLPPLPVQSPEPIIPKEEAPQLGPHEFLSEPIRAPGRPSSVQPSPHPPTRAVNTEGPRRRTVSASGDGPRKVTFRSPPPTPTASVLLDEAVRQDEPEVFTDTDSLMMVRTDSLPSSARPSTTQSHTQSRRSSHNTTTFPHSSRKSSGASQRTSSPEKQPSSIMMRNKDGTLSPSPSEMSLGTQSTMSWLPVAGSWGEMADQELVANLGPVERTRQEVLFEIVSSEERYVNDLVTISDVFCKALLPASATSPHIELYDPIYALARTRSPASPAFSSFNMSSSDLPIASKFASTSQFRSPSDSSVSIGPITPIDDFSVGMLGTGLGFGSLPGQSKARQTAYNTLTNGAPPSPSRKPSMTSLKHQSLPPLSRATSTVPSRVASRTSYHPPPTSASGKISKYSRFSASSSRLSSGSSLNLPPIIDKDEIQVPESLEKVLKAVMNGMLEGHLKLVEALRKRYDDQYPLVRSLADVFNRHSTVFEEYSVYVLHLERALEQIQAALSSIDPASKPKRLSKQHTLTPLQKLGYYITQLSNSASAQGIPSLSISLSKPFQRLLKYPLLFQNLLFNTDPTLMEYEKTLGMCEEVERMVRVLEDEKIGEEGREATRDGWGRVEGLGGGNVLVLPKASRLLLWEKPLREVSSVDPKKVLAEKDTEPVLRSHIPPSSMKPATEQKGTDGTVRNTKSIKRLGGLLKPEKEYWIVRFTDMSLLCLKTGTTSLPMSATNQLKQGKNKRASSDGYPGIGMARGRERNLYRFLKVWEWHLEEEDGGGNATSVAQKPQSAPPVTNNGTLSKGQSLSLATIPGTPHKPGPRPDQPGFTSARAQSMSNISPSRAGASQDEGDGAASDSESVMSFPYPGDVLKPVPKKTVLKPRTTDGPRPPPTSLRAKPRSPSASSFPSRPPSSARAFSTSAQSLSQASARSRIGDTAQVNAKFANRLRSVDDPTGAAAGRMSLPPAMMRSASAADSVSVVGGRRAVSTIGSRAGSVMSRRAEDESSEGTVRARPPSVRPPLHAPKRASTPASTATSRRVITPTLPAGQSARVVPSQARQRGSLPLPPHPSSSAAGGPPGGDGKVSAATAARRARASVGPAAVVSAPVGRRVNPTLTPTNKPSANGPMPSKPASTTTLKSPPSSLPLEKKSGLKSMQSTDSGLAEVWRTTYGGVDTDQLGSTPRKRAESSNTDLSPETRRPVSSGLRPLALAGSATIARDRKSSSPTASMASGVGKRPLVGATAPGMGAGAASRRDLGGKF
ncbi:hypothetical protein I350_05581 [Cryptococcus amylolentus CBS 6273]|uniref:DH domain-containing protein n=1 Tax=Cryptococcus amylolentus CBS 6273 TaxID=1296118 RepID=A0A1E3JW01_9TREE|nr:hypothetical protein I350_05581 [Cryptococcus amylolentus CBS 6273]